MGDHNVKVRGVEEERMGETRGIAIENRLFVQQKQEPFPSPSAWAPG